MISLHVLGVELKCGHAVEFHLRSGGTASMLANLREVVENCETSLCVECQKKEAGTKTGSKSDLMN